jgi:hypothetical protein
MTLYNNGSILKFVMGCHEKLEAGKCKTYQIRTRRATRRRVGISRGYISATVSNISRSSSSGKAAVESTSSSVMVVESKWQSTAFVTVTP